MSWAIRIAGKDAALLRSEVSKHMQNSSNPYGIPLDSMHRIIALLEKLPPITESGVSVEAHGHWSDDGTGSEEIKINRLHGITRI